VAVMLTTTTLMAILGWKAATATKGHWYWSRILSLKAKVLVNIEMLHWNAKAYFQFCFTPIYVSLLMAILITLNNYGHGSLSS